MRWNGLVLMRRCEKRMDTRSKGTSSKATHSNICRGKIGFSVANWVEKELQYKYKWAWMEVLDT